MPPSESAGRLQARRSIKLWGREPNSAREVETVLRVWPADIGGQMHPLQRDDKQIADIGLAPRPPQPRGARARMMIPMPILALEKVHQDEPRDVAARVLPQRDARLAMADAFYEALCAAREPQPARAA